MLFAGGGMTAAGPAENRRGFVLGGKTAEGVIQAVIAQTAAHLVEEIVAFAEGVDEIGQGGNLRITDLGQVVHPGIQQFGEVNVERLVGPEGGKDLGGERRGGDGAVPGQVVGGIVGGDRKSNS